VRVRTRLFLFVCRKSRRVCYYVTISYKGSVPMKKVSLLFAVLLLFLFYACDPLVLPDLEGMDKDEIEETFDEMNLEPNFIIDHSVDKDTSYVFLEYGQFLSTGDAVEPGETIYIIISAESTADYEYFEPVDIDYDGPRLDEAFFDENQYDYYIFDEEEADYYGGGRAFDVSYEDGRHSEGEGGCIDGDTTVFDYPETVYERIESSTPSVRYLNIDTPETWPPGEEEEWGQPATQYVCDVLADAERIVLQTDPGDNLLGLYGRLLAWVWVQMSGDDEFELLNYNIVRQGLGTVAYEYGAGETDVTIYDNKPYNEWMHHAETLAREEERGMFSDTLRDYYWDYHDDAPHPIRWP